MTARDDFPHNAAFAKGASGGDPYLIAKRRETARSLDHIDELRAALVEAREDLAHWAAYAPEYFQAKWNLDADLARIDAVIAKFQSEPRGFPQ